MVHAVAGQDQQRPARPEAALKQRLPDRVGRRHRLAIGAPPPAAAWLALGDEPSPRVGLRPLPQAVHYRRRMVAERPGGTQQQLTAGLSVCDDLRSREQWHGDVGVPGHLVLPQCGDRTAPTGRSTDQWRYETLL